MGRTCKFEPRWRLIESSHPCTSTWRKQAPEALVGSELTGRVKDRNPLGVAASPEARPSPLAQSLAFQADRRSPPRHVAELGKGRLTWRKLKMGRKKQQVRVPRLQSRLSPIIPSAMKGKSLKLPLFPRNNGPGSKVSPRSRWDMSFSVGSGMRSERHREEFPRRGKVAPSHPYDSGSAMCLGDMS